MRPIALSLIFSVLAAEGSPGVALAEGHDAANEPARPEPNRPPKFVSDPETEPSIPDGSGGRGWPLRVGRTARITLDVQDPDEDPLTYTVDPLPPGATFDKELGVLTWLPTRDQLGSHKLTFEASDGRLAAKRTVLFVVQPNRAPKDIGDSTIFRTARPAEKASESAADTVSYLTQDPDADDLTFEARTLPRGAHLATSNRTLNLIWAPTEEDVGEHELVVDVSDGELRTTLRGKVVVIPEWEGRDYHRWLLLGGGPSAFLTHGDGEMFVGGTFDVTLVAIREDGIGAYTCAHSSTNIECHASHHRFYGQFEVLDSMRSQAPSVFTYGAGYSASLEYDPARRYLIPHYGIDVGGLVRSGVGHRAQVHPYLGLHLWTSDAIWIDGTLGYRVTPGELVDLSGPTFALRVILNAW